MPTQILCHKITVTLGCSFQNCLYKPSCIFSSAYTLSAKIQTNLQHHVYRTYTYIQLFAHHRQQIPCAWSQSSSTGLLHPLQPEQENSIKFNFVLDLGNIEIHYWKSSFTCITVMTCPHVCATSFYIAVKGISFP